MTLQKNMASATIADGALSADVLSDAQQTYQMCCFVSATSLCAATTRVEDCRWTCGDSSKRYIIDTKIQRPSLVDLKDMLEGGY